MDRHIAKDEELAIRPITQLETNHSQRLMAKRLLINQSRECFGTSAGSERWAATAEDKVRVARGLLLGGMAFLQLTVLTSVLNEGGGKG